MSKKVFSYIRNGFKGSHAFIKQNIRFHLGYVLYSFISLVGKLLGLTYPIFVMADIKLSENIVKNKKLSFNNTLDDSNDIKKVWKTVLFNLIKLMLLAIGIGLTVVLTNQLSMLGTMIDNTFDFRYYYFRPLFIIISIALGVIYVLFVLLKFSMGNYLLQSNNNNGLSEAFIDSYKIVNLKVAAKITLINLFYLITTVLFSLLSYYLILVSYNELILIAYVLMLIIISIIFIMQLPRFVFSYNLSLYELYDDLANDYYLKLALEKEGEIYEDKFSDEDLLNVLFNETPSKVQIKQDIDNDKTLESDNELTKELAPQDESTDEIDGI